MAKGVSIIGVVLWHVTLKVPEGNLTWLASLGVWLEPLRMPLFFLVSGYFSGKVFQYSLPQLFRRRIWFLLVPYLIWSSVERCVERIEFHWVFGDAFFSIDEFLVAIFVNFTFAWFLYALIIFNLFLWVVRSLPSVVSLLLSFSPILLLGWQQQNYFIGKAILFLPFFIGGAYFRSQISGFAKVIETPFKAQFTLKSLCLYGVTAISYVAGVLLHSCWERVDEDVVIQWALPGKELLDKGDLYLLVHLLEQILELPAGIVGAVLISHIPALSTFVKFVGRHTLPIYLAHPIGMTVGYGFFMAHRDYVVSLAGAWPMENTWFWIGACFFYSAAASLALWALGKVPILGWTLVPPRIDKRRPVVEPMVASKEPEER